MNAYNKRKWAFYMGLVEHFFRLAVRRTLAEVQGTVNRQWHQETVRWIHEKCTEEERALIKSFYTYSQSVKGCTNYKVTEEIYEIADRFAVDMGLC